MGRWRDDVNAVMSPGDLVVLRHPVATEQYPEGTYEIGHGAADQRGRLEGNARVAIPDSVCDQWFGDVMGNVTFEYACENVAVVGVAFEALRAPAGTVPLAN